MLNKIAIFTIGSAILLGGGPVNAGDLTSMPTPASGCHYVRVCRAHACNWRPTCRINCPDPYSCHPLYGAYAPYGGANYWGAYTTPPWNPR